MIWFDEVIFTWHIDIVSEGVVLELVSDQIQEQLIIYTANINVHISVADYLLTDYVCTKTGTQIHWVPEDNSII